MTAHDRRASSGAPRCRVLRWPQSPSAVALLPPLRCSALRCRSRPWKGRRPMSACLVHSPLADRPTSLSSRTPKKPYADIASNSQQTQKTRPLDHCPLCPNVSENGRFVSADVRFVSTHAVGSGHAGVAHNEAHHRPCPGRFRPRICARTVPWNLQPQDRPPFPLRPSAVNLRPPVSPSPDCLRRQARGGSNARCTVRVHCTT